LPSLPFLNSLSLSDPPFSFLLLFYHPILNFSSVFHKLLFLELEF